jgi:hypothetical protein
MQISEKTAVIVFFEMRTGDVVLTSGNMIPSGRNFSDARMALERRKFRTFSGSELSSPKRRCHDESR